VEQYKMNMVIERSRDDAFSRIFNSLYQTIKILSVMRDSYQSRERLVSKASAAELTE